MGAVFELELAFGLALRPNYSPTFLTIIGLTVTVVCLNTGRDEVAATANFGTAIFTPKLKTAPDVTVSGWSTIGIGKTPILKSWKHDDAHRFDFNFIEGLCR